MNISRRQAVLSLFLSAAMIPGFSTGSELPKATVEQPFVNGLGMKFVSVSGTRVLFCIWPTRVKDFTAFVNETGYDATQGAYTLTDQGQARGAGCWNSLAFKQTGDDPVCCIRWEDVKVFCKWLTEKERKEKRLGENQFYRMPTDAEWNVAVGLENEPVWEPKEKGYGTGWPPPRIGEVFKDFLWGSQWPPPPDSGNFAGEEVRAGYWPEHWGVIEGYRDGFPRTSPVGSFKPNRFGLYDMAGNVTQLCEDWYDQDRKLKVMRGSSWQADATRTLSISVRRGGRGRYDMHGFRVVLAVEETPDPVVAAPPGKIKAVPPGLSSRSQPGKRWNNSLNMPFVAVPGTQVKFCVWKTQVGEFEAFVNATKYAATNQVRTLTKGGWRRRGGSWQSPGFHQTSRHPVCGINWEDAKAFCKWLTEQDRAEGLLKPGQQYRLPTDAEWSVAVGLPPEAGRSPKEKDQKIEDVYPWGNSWPPENAGNYAGEEAKDLDWPGYLNYEVIEGYRDNYARTSPAGSFKANRFGLYDLGGNLWEWCEDFYDGKSGPRLLRGGSWFNDARCSLLSSARRCRDPIARYVDAGFRCVLAGPDNDAAK